MKFALALVLSILLMSVTYGAERLSPESIYQLKSNWINQDGKSITLQSFQGHPVILAMMYTQCQGECPLLVNDMKKIEKALPAKDLAQVHFVLVSFNSEHDTPNTLKKYATTRDLDTKIWTLLTSSKESVRELSAVLGVRYRKTGEDEFAHSSVISVLDSGGVVRFQQKGLRNGPGPAVAAVEPLMSSFGAESKDLMHELKLDSMHIQAEDFQFADESGKTHHLTEYLGKPLILHFWATWCSSCADEIPRLAQISEKWKELGLQFLAISVDPKEKKAEVSRFLARLKPSMPARVIIPGKAADRYWAWGLPITYLVSSNGTIFARALGERDWSGPQVSELFQNKNVTEKSKR